MDTLGTIRPVPNLEIEESQRTEAFERLRYLALRNRCGVLTGRRGSGKSEMLLRLKGELQREGVTASLIKLAGLSPEELPLVIAAEFGLGIEPNSNPILAWAILQDYATACQQSGTRHVLLFDQLDRAPVALGMCLERLISLFDNAFAAIFAARPGLNQNIKAFLKNHCWMKVQLDRLTSADVSQSLAKEFSSQHSNLHVTPEAIVAAKAVSQGRVDQLKRLAEFAVLAAEADEIRVINEEVIRSLQREIQLNF